MNIPILLLLGGSTLVAVHFLLKRKSEFSGPIEPLAPHEPNTGCELVRRAGVEAFRDYVLKRFGGADQGILNRQCGQYTQFSEHHDGRAWDWRIIPGLKNYTEPDVDGFLEWVTKNDNEIARRAGIMYMLIHDRAWRSYDTQYGKAGEWYTYATNKPHIDHVHISFSFDGADGKTSFYQSIL